jgi:uncharacterized membrane protein YfcA
MNTFKNVMTGIWSRVPLILRSVLVGFLVSTIGVSISLLLASVIPMPWAFLLMCLVLVLYLRFFSGRPGRGMNKDRRRTLFREVNMPWKIWILSIPAALLIRL